MRLKDAGNKKILKNQQNQPGTKTAKSTMREIMKPSRQKKKREVGPESMRFLQKRERQEHSSVKANRKD